MPNFSVTKKRKILEAVYESVDRQAFELLKLRHYQGLEEQVKHRVELTKARILKEVELFDYPIGLSDKEINEILGNETDTEGTGGDQQADHDVRTCGPDW